MSLLPISANREITSHSQEKFSRKKIETTNREKVVGIIKHIKKRQPSRCIYQMTFRQGVDLLEIREKDQLNEPFICSAAAAERISCFIGRLERGEHLRFIAFNELFCFENVFIPVTLSDNKKWTLIRPESFSGYKPPAEGAIEKFAFNAFHTCTFKPL